MIDLYPYAQFLFCWLENPPPMCLWRYRVGAPSLAGWCSAAPNLDFSERWFINIDHHTFPNIIESQEIDRFSYANHGIYCDLNCWKKTIQPIVYIDQTLVSSNSQVFLPLHVIAEHQHQLRVRDPASRSTMRMVASALSMARTKGVPMISEPKDSPNWLLAKVHTWEALAGSEMT